MEQARKPSPSDVREAEWAILAPLVPAVKPGGRPARWSRRELMNGIVDVVRGGTQWRALPHDLPPWQTVSCSFRRWRNDGTWEAIHTALREQGRRRAPGARRRPARPFWTVSASRRRKGGAARG